jgi:Tfp pilus assembly protein PilF/4-amino-4-deoxy-L-arabinose transferase-like glycosyltransferase
MTPVSGVSPRWWQWPAALAALGVAAFAIRAANVVALSSSPFLTALIGDSLQFDILAKRVLAGDWVNSGIYYQGQLYPYFLAMVYAIVGQDPVAVRLVQSAIGAVACVLLAAAGAGFFDRRSGLAAGILVALYPPAIFFDALIQKSSPDLLFVALLLLALAACLREPKAAWLLVGGVAIGALSWNRENARILLPLVIAWLLLQFRGTPLTRRAQWAAVVTLGVAAVLGPVTVRNFRLTGEFVLTTSQSGPNFYIGNHLGASGGYEPLAPGRGNFEYERQDAIRIAEAASGRSLSSTEVSDYWWRRTFVDIRQDPVAWVRLVARKTWLTVGAHEPIDTESLEAYADYSWVLQVTRPLTFGVLLGFAVFGGWVHRRRWRDFVILVGIFLAMACSVVAFFVFARYRFPLVPVAALFAGAGVAALTRISRGGIRDLALPILVCALLASILHIPVRTSSDETYFNYGTHFLREGRPADAVPMLREAVRRDPSHAEARLSLGLALQQTSQHGAAAEEFRAAITASPNSSEAHTGLAISLHRQGLLPDAVREYEAAVRLEEGNVEAMSNLALALREQGRMEEAIAWFRRAIAAKPQNVPVLMNLGSLLLEAGRLEESSVVFDQAAAAAKTPKETLEAEYAAGQALARAGRVPEAAARLERALTAARAAGEAGAAATIESGLQLLRGGR